MNFYDIVLLVAVLTKTFLINRNTFGAVRSQTQLHSILNRTVLCKQYTVTIACFTTIFVDFLSHVCFAK